MDRSFLRTGFEYLEELHCRVPGILHVVTKRRWYVACSGSSGNFRLEYYEGRRTDVAGPVVKRASIPARSEKRYSSFPLPDVT